jgi:hypothetical protein
MNHFCHCIEFENVYMINQIFNNFYHNSNNIHVTQKFEALFYFLFIIKRFQKFPAIIINEK